MAARMTEVLGRHRVWLLEAHDMFVRDEYYLAKYEGPVTARVVFRTAMVDIKLSGRSDVRLVGPANMGLKKMHPDWNVLRYSADEVQRTLDLMAACNG